MTIDTSHDTSKFVCDNIERVWNEHLREQYPGANTIVILCDGGGSKYNPIEHRLFSQITRSWSRVPLLSIEDATRRTAETTTSKGLTVHVDINTKTYDTQRPIDESYERERRRRN